MPSGVQNSGLKWVIALTVAFGAFMAVMDVSVVNVALPHMMGSFGASLSSITWVATSYSIAEIIFATMAGWTSTLLGRKRLYLLSFIIFTIGSALCGVASSFEQMILFRVIQGIGGGALIPVSQAILRETFPDEEQGMAMALYSMGVVLAPACGPIFGGWLTDHMGWPWIFYINVPVCAVGVMMTSIFIHDPDYLKRGVKRVDWAGIGLLALCLTTMQVVLERGQEQNWFDSKFIVAGVALFVLTLGLLLVWELRVEEPVVNLRLLKNIPLSAGSLLGGVFGIGLYGTTFILPQFTQELLGYSAFEAGLVLAPRALVLLCIMPLVGWLYKFVDARFLILFGFVFLIWSYYDLAHLSLETGFYNLIPLLLIMGIGMPFMFVTLSTVSLSTVPRKYMTDASAIFTLSRRVGGNIGYALAATLVARGQQIHRTYLVAHVTPYDTEYLQTKARIVEALVHHGLSSVAAEGGSIVMIDQMIRRQASMMAYNDVSMVLGMMFVALIPFVFLLPRRAPRSIVKAG